MVSRLLVLVGAAATILSAFLTWVTVSGLTVTLDLALAAADLGPDDRTVAGTDTALWPALVAVGVVAAVLGLLGAARPVLVGLGLLTTLAGALLLAYMANVIELETRGSSELEQAAADALLESSIGPGTPVLVVGGALILLGGLAQRRARA